MIFSGRGIVCEMFNITKSLTFIYDLKEVLDKHMDVVTQKPFEMNGTRDQTSCQLRTQRVGDKISLEMPGQRSYL